MNTVKAFAETWTGEQTIDFALLRIIAGATDLRPSLTPADFDRLPGLVDLFAATERLTKELGYADEEVDQMNAGLDASAEHPVN